MIPRAVALAVALLLLAGCGAPIREDDRTEAPPATTGTGAAAPPVTIPAGETLNPCHYWDAGLMERQLAQAASADAALPGLRALVAPHYAPELDLLTAALAGLEPDAYDLIAVIGPDHTGQGAGIAVSGRGWDTPLGVLKGDAAAATALTGNPDIGAIRNHTLLADDHAVSTHMPYLARLVPEAAVVGVLLSRHTDLPRLSALADALAELGEQRRLLVLLSVDFSHYQTLPAAQGFDAETVDIIERGDLAALLSLESTHVDSPETLALLLLLGERWGLTPTLEQQRRNTFVENGEPMAGSFMVWSLREAH